MSDVGGGETSDAEEAVVRHLEVFREERLEGDRALVEAVVRKARFQQVIRAPLRVVSVIAEAFMDGARILFGAEVRRP